MKDHSSAHGGLTQSKLKQEARSLKRESNLSHREALEIVARKHGFPTWLHASKALPMGTPDLAQPKPADPAPSPGAAAETQTAGEFTPPPPGARGHMLSDQVAHPDCSLRDMASNVPPHFGTEIEGLMRCALVQAGHLMRTANRKTVKPIGFNFLLQQEGGNILDGDIHSGKLITPRGRDWGAVVLRKWILEHNVDRCAVYMDVRPQSKSGNPTQFAIIGMEEGRCLIWMFAVSKVYDKSEPTPDVSSRGGGFWPEAFKLAMVERKLGKVHPQVRVGAFEFS